MPDPTPARAQPTDRAMPADRSAWLAEVRRAMAAGESVAAAAGLDPGDEDHAWSQCVEDEVVRAARCARGIDEPLADPDATMDEVTDLTVALRRAAPGDPDDHHVNEVQHALLYYVGAHLHANLVAPADAARVVGDCWDAALPAGEGDADQPWPARRPAPDGGEAWFAELKQVWTQARQPPPLRTSEGRPWLARGGDLREAALALALHQRGCQAAQAEIADLAAMLRRMADEMAHEGPEIAQLAKHPALAFSLYYLWTHVFIGHADEEQAMQVVAVCAERMTEFAPLKRR